MGFRSKILKPTVRLTGKALYKASNATLKGMKGLAPLERSLYRASPYISSIASFVAVTDPEPSTKVKAAELAATMYAYSKNRENMKPILKEFKYSTRKAMKGFKKMRSFK